MMPVVIMSVVVPVGLSVIVVYCCHDCLLSTYFLNLLISDGCIKSPFVLPQAFLS